MDSSAKLKVLISGAPENCTLKQIRKEVTTTLNKDSTVVSRVKKFKTPSGDIVSGKFEVELASLEDVQELLHTPVIEIEHDDELCVMRVTRYRPAASSSSSLLQLSRTSPSLHTPLEMPPPGFAERIVPPTSLNIPDPSEDLPSTSDSDCSVTDSTDDEFAIAKVSQKKKLAAPAPARHSISKLSPKNIKKSKKPKTPKRQETSDEDSDSSPVTSPKQRTARFPVQKTSFYDLLQKDPEIFQRYKDNGVLVQFDPDDIPEKKVAEYFRQKLPGWHPIKTALLNDGYLLIYESNEIATCVVNQSHVIKGETLNLYHKPIPPVYYDRILLKGNFRTAAEVKEIMGSLSDISVKVKKPKDWDKFLVNFDQDVDIDKMQKKLKRLKLKKMNPQIIKVCQTDCIRVQNVKEGVAEFSVKLAFMNKKLTRGDVTCVECDEDKGNDFYVYYADYEDAERVIKSSKRKEIKVQQQAVEVSLFWRGIEGSLDGSSSHIYQFYFSLEALDQDIVTFVCKARQHSSEFQKELGDLAQVDIEEESDTSEFKVKVKPLLTPEQSEDMEQEKFESKCKQKILRFFTKFKTDTRRFHAIDKERVRSDNGWNDAENYIEQEIKKDETVAVYVRWDDRDRDAVKAAGLPSHVHSFMDWFDVKCKHTEKSEEFDATSFKILISCGIVEDIKSVFKTMVEIETDESTNRVILSGSRDSVVAVLNAIQDSLKSTQEQDMSFLHSSQQEFIRRVMHSHSASQSNEIVEFIQEKLQDSNIKVCLQRQGTALKLVYGSRMRSELASAQDEIRALIKHQVIPIESGFDEIMSEADWKNLQRSIEANGRLCVIPNKPSSSITLVGLPLSFNTEFENISAYMADNVELDVRIDMSYSQTRFFCDFSKEIGAEDEIPESVEWYKEAGGIHLRGRACIIRKTENWIRATVKKFVTHSHSIDIPGISDYFRGKSGLQFLEGCSKETTCFITFDSADTEEWKLARQNTDERREEEEPQYEVVSEMINEMDLNQDEKKESWGSSIAKTFSSAKKWLQGKTPDLTPQQERSVQVKVIKGDILQSDCEIMINTTGPDFNLTLSKVSQALIAKAGRQMITECNDNPIAESEFLRATKAPNLSFKNVIHLVSPNSADKITEHLLEALITAETVLRRHSIAVPAIGTGQIAMSDADAARYIRKAIDNFKRTNPKVLKRIDVVVFQQRMLSSFQNAIVSKLSKSKIKKHKTSQPMTSHVAAPPAAAASAPQQRMQNISGVTLSSGDILSSNCEVMINTTGGNFDLTASQLSALVLRKAGNSIITECNNNPVQQSPECKVTSGGNTQFKYIVHFITPNIVALAQNLENVLVLIDSKLQKSSVAIPAIGTGAAGLPVDQVVLAMNQAICSFMAKKPTYLKRIDVIIFDANILPKFQSNITSTVQQPQPVQQMSQPISSSMDDEDEEEEEDNKAASTSALPTSKSGLSKLEGGNDQNHRLVLYFTSNSASNNQAAIDTVSTKAGAKVLNIQVRDDVLEMLDDDDLLDLKGIEREFTVSLKVPDDGSENVFEIWGLKNNVNEAYKYTQKRLHEYSKAVTCADYLTWKYVDPDTKSWEQFGLLENFELESMFKEDNTGNGHIRVKMNGKKKDLWVDFSTMDMKEGATATYKIKKFVTSGNDQFPGNWNGSKSRQLVQLDQQNNQTEYNNVITKFTNGGMKINNVVRLDRIENKRQYTQFLAQKQDVQERMKTNGSIKNLPVTKELFHGTSNDIVEQIYKGGFDRSYCGKNATYYGNGVYFATTSSYSHSYASPDQKGHRRMFLVDVITGQFAQGAQGMKYTPLIPNTPDSHDSLVDNMTTPGMHVVFKDASVYPLYILTYT